MIALTLIAITVLYIAAFVLVGIKTRTWKRRAIGWGVLAIPLVLWLWDLPIIKVNHYLACKREGGLKVYIQPEKTDRVRLDGDQQLFNYDDVDAKYVLQKFYPMVKFVEAKETSGINKEQYFEYTVDSRSLSKGRNDYTLIKKALVNEDKHVYILTKRYQKKTHLTKKQVALFRDGNLYATWTTVTSSWNSSGFIRHGWQCYTGRVPENELVLLLLK